VIASNVHITKEYHCLVFWGMYMPNALKRKFLEIVESKLEDKQCGMGSKNRKFKKMGFHLKSNMLVLKQMLKKFISKWE